MGHGTVGDCRGPVGPEKASLLQLFLVATAWSRGWASCPVLLSASQTVTWSGSRAQMVPWVLPGRHGCSSHPSPCHLPSPAPATAQLLGLCAAARCRHAGAHSDPCPARCTPQVPQARRGPPHTGKDSLRRQHGKWGHSHSASGRTGGGHSCTAPLGLPAVPAPAVGGLEAGVHMELQKVTWALSTCNRKWPGLTACSRVDLRGPHPALPTHQS